MYSQMSVHTFKQMQGKLKRKSNTVIDIVGLIKQYDMKRRQESKTFFITADIQTRFMITLRTIKIAINYLIFFK